MVYPFLMFLPKERLIFLAFFKILWNRYDFLFRFRIDIFVPQGIQIITKYKEKQVIEDFSCQSMVEIIFSIYKI